MKATSEEVIALSGATATIVALVGAIIGLVFALFGQDEVIRLHGLFFCGLFAFGLFDCFFAACRAVGGFSRRRLAPGHFFRIRFGSSNGLYQIFCRLAFRSGRGRTCRSNRSNRLDTACY